MRSGTAMSISTTFIILLVTLLSGCGDPPRPIVSCASVDDLVPVCGVNRPEDMELLPDGHTLVISQLGEVDGSSPGSLALYNTITRTITPVPEFTEAAAENWGAADCPGPPGEWLFPHGIDLSTRADGRLQLLVVNHGNRERGDNERIEFFEISPAEPVYQLAWHGCVIASPDSLLNDVVALPAGGFLATHMFDKSSPKIGPSNLAQIKGLLGFDTGYVVHWDGTRFNSVKGTEAALPNGIQISPDGQHLYLNAYLGDEVRKISYPDGRLEAKATVNGPDNIQWDLEGKLLVASQTRPIKDVSACYKIEKGACGAAFEIIALDPVTMQAKSIFRHEGAPMGAATVAQQVGDFLYIGTFVGDRMLRVKMPIVDVSAD